MPPSNYLITTLLLLFLLASPPSTTATITTDTPKFREAPAFRNGKNCPKYPSSTIHIAMTLDYSSPYLRGSMASILSILQHSSCPENSYFHFLAIRAHFNHLNKTITTTFPNLKFTLYNFKPSIVETLISSSIRQALDEPLNYARIYLANLVSPTVNKVIYFDSDLIVVDDISKLWNIELNGKVLGAPEYCHANFTHYFTQKFWLHPNFPKTFENRKACYFNTGVMVIDLQKWRNDGYTHKLEHWMRVQKRYRIYELGSLPPFLLVFSGHVKQVEHRWNQHGLGGDNLEGQCRDLHPGPVSLLHWSGKGKPWLRLDSKKPCPLDSLWAPYDLFRHESLFLDS